MAYYTSAARVSVSFASASKQLRRAISRLFSFIDFFDKMLASSVQDVPLPRVWFQNEAQEISNPFASIAQADPTERVVQCLTPPPTSMVRNDIVDPLEIFTPRDFTLYQKPTETSALTECVTLDASELGDFPIVYKAFGLKEHQLPVVGVYVDKRVCPGFKYKVVPLPGPVGRQTSLLFGGRALTLMSIGRGYSRRFTFEANNNCLNENENYFWSDSRPEGFAFELEIVSNGDKFTIFDANHEAQGTMEIVKIEGQQVETNSELTKFGIQKKAKINFIGKVEFYETGVAKPMPMNGTVIALKKKGSMRAEVLKVININIKHHRYYLTPGLQKHQRRVTVRGEDIGDVPTRYTMTGLEPYEIPVVGTYVDPRVIPGFCYKVRPNDRKEHLFGGRALKLCSIGMGYAKRLTFQPDSLLNPNNFLWSDSHPDGIGLEPRAVHKGMKFSIYAGDRQLGEAIVFRTDLPQQEERMEIEQLGDNKWAIEKYIHINVTCVVKLAIIGGSSNESEENLMRVYGLALVRKEPNNDTAQVVRVDNIAFDSQLNILFANTHTELTFYPR